jgi:hypothetical protein
VLSADGSVLGIAVSQLLTGQNLNFAVPINYARGLLQNLASEPLEVLEPNSASGEDPEIREMAATEPAVNRGLRFELLPFAGYTAEYEVSLGEDLQRRTRITYRVIETVGGGEPRVERYLQSETTRRTEPFGTRQTVRRERVRSMMAQADLSPQSSRGEISTWTEGGWRTAEHDVHFDGDRVLGVVTDTVGNTVELDRHLPRGVILREMGDLAFGTLAADSLIGRSVELTVFDPWTGEVVADRFDVMRAEELQVMGRDHDVLRVNRAAGLEDETVYFEAERPRLPLRRVSEDGTEVESIISLEGRPWSIQPEDPRQD